MLKFKYNKSNPITKYIIDKMEKRNPEDSIYNLSKRTGLNSGTIHNAFNSVRSWQQCILLMQICGDLGISMEEVLTQNQIKYDSNKEIRYWRELFHKEKIDKEKLEKELQQLNNKLDRIKKDLTT